MTAAVAAPKLATEYTLPLLCCPLDDLNSSPVCPRYDPIPMDLQVDILPTVNGQDSCPGVSNRVGGSRFITSAAVPWG